LHRSRHRRLPGHCVLAHFAARSVPTAIGFAGFAFARTSLRPAYRLVPCPALADHLGPEPGEQDRMLPFFHLPLEGFGGACPPCQTWLRRLLSITPAPHTRRVWSKYFRSFGSYHG